MQTPCAPECNNAPPATINQTARRSFARWLSIVRPRRARVSVIYPPVKCLAHRLAPPTAHLPANQRRPITRAQYAR